MKHGGGGKQEGNIGGKQDGKGTHKISYLVCYCAAQGFYGDYMQIGCCRCQY